jgi:hypothetical protein
MRVESQVSATDFLASQKAVLQKLPLCAPGPFTVGPVQVILDRMEFGGNFLRHNPAPGGAEDNGSGAP